MNSDRETSRLWGGRETCYRPLPLSIRLKLRRHGASVVVGAKAFRVLNWFIKEVASIMFELSIRGVESVVQTLMLSLGRYRLSVLVARNRCVIEHLVRHAVTVRRKFLMTRFGAVFRVGGIGVTLIFGPVRRVVGERCLMGLSAGMSM